MVEPRVGRERRVNRRLQTWLDTVSGDPKPLPDSVRGFVAQGVVRTDDGLLVFQGSQVALKNVDREVLEDSTGIEAFVNSVHIDEYGDSGSVITYSSQLVEAVDLIADSIQRAAYPGTYCIVGNVNDSEFISSTVRFHTLRLEEGPWIGDLEGFEDSEGVLVETVTIP